MNFRPLPWLSALSALGCAPPPASPPSASPHLPVARSASVNPVATPLEARKSVARPLTSPAAEAACEVVSLAERGYSVSLELKADVTDFAVGTPPTVAARHGDLISLYDGRRWKELPPLEPSPPGLKYNLFFGRDNQPRLMGYEPAAEPRAFYRRFKGGRFQPEPSELGPLGSPRGALYGVLGFADPEVVCKPREVCLVKRLSGWNRVPAHEAPVPIFVGRGDAWAFVEHSLHHLETQGFREFSPSRRFEQPSALWVDERGLPWVLDGAALFHASTDAGWTRSEVPFGNPQALAGTSATEVWVAGDGGAARFDGSRFVCIRELAVGLRGITRAGDDIWFWGAGGAFRVRTAPRG